MLFFGTTMAQSSNCPDPVAVTAITETTSGCSPSSCRGAQTKFGEAKVITQLRKALIALKAEIEQYQPVKFDARTYSIHGIVGETDAQSLDIIRNEVQRIEADFTAKLKYTPSAFLLPENKAQQVHFLQRRISDLKNALHLKQ